MKKVSIPPTQTGLRAIKDLVGKSEGVKNAPSEGSPKKKKARIVKENGGAPKKMDETEVLKTKTQRIKGAAITKRGRLCVPRNQRTQCDRPKQRKKKAVQITRKKTKVGLTFNGKEGGYKGGRGGGRRLTHRRTTQEEKSGGEETIRGCVTMERRENDRDEGGTEDRDHGRTKYR